MGGQIRAHLAEKDKESCIYGPIVFATECLYVRWLGKLKTRKNGTISAKKDIVTEEGSLGDVYVVHSLEVSRTKRPKRAPGHECVTLVGLVPDRLLLPCVLFSCSFQTSCQ